MIDIVRLAIHNPCMANRPDELLQRALAEDDPEAALRAVTALRARLTALEDDHVRNAVRAGISWADIARALGISRQAAHKRFAARSRADEPPRIKGTTHTTEQARRTVLIATEEAAALGHPSAGSEHLLLALLRDDTGPVVAALEELGVSRGAVRREVRALYGDAEAELDSRHGRAPISARGHRALESAIREASESGAPEVAVEHVLLGTLRDAEGGAVRVLEALGLTAGAVEAGLRAALDEPQPPPARLR